MAAAKRPQHLKQNLNKAAQNVRGQLLGRAITTKAAVPTNARSIGDQVTKLLEPLQGSKAASKQFAALDLVAAWPEIVGPRLAGLCLPVKLRPAPKSRSRHAKAVDGGILEVSADPAMVIDLDYGQALIVERINAFYGYSAVSGLKVIAKPLARVETAAQKPRQTTTPTPADRQKAASQTGLVEDPALRAALAALGASIAASDRQKKLS
jgi:hypothetical protein